MKNIFTLARGVFTSHSWVAHNDTDGARARNSDKDRFSSWVYLLSSALATRRVITSPGARLPSQAASLGASSSKVPTRLETASPNGHSCRDDALATRSLGFDGYVGAAESTAGHGEPVVSSIHIGVAAAAVCGDLHGCDGQ